MHFCVGVELVIEETDFDQHVRENREVDDDFVDKVMVLLTVSLNGDVNVKILEGHVIEPSFVIVNITVGDVIVIKNFGEDCVQIEGIKVSLEDRVKEIVNSVVVNINFLLVYEKVLVVMPEILDYNETDIVDFIVVVRGNDSPVDDF